ncbi:GAF domain-containing protein [Marivita sp. S2033]|uniref:GAF domain-containing protein n=1 Tax=Marivita sp. S2033 TaxID=3373187 RepID=UPI003982D6C2
MPLTAKDKYLPVDDFPAKPIPHHSDALNNAQRLAALDRTGMMDSLPEEEFDRFVRLATQIIGVPVGLVSFVDNERQYFKAHQGLPETMDDAPETPLTHSFCQYVVSTGTPLAVSDAKVHPLLKHNLAVSELGVSAYLGVPIRSPEGQTLGSFCAIDDQVHHWSDADLAVLLDLAAMLETELRLRHERRALRMLAQELNHRVKNLFSILGGMISLTARTAETPADMAKALQGRLSALSWAHELISPAIASGDSAQMSIALDALVRRLLEPHVEQSDKTLRIDLPDLRLEGRPVTDIALVLHELTTNAAKYGALAAPDGTLAITGQVEDDGGVTLEWRETGGAEIPTVPSETGFGSKLIDITVRAQLGGQIETDWLATGVHHRLRFPATVFSAGEAHRRRPDRPRSAT